MRAGLLIVAALLAGCTFPDPPAEPPPSVACAEPRLDVEPEDFRVGEHAEIRLALRNCGTTPLEVLPPGPCGGTRQMRVTIRGANAEYEHHAALAMPQETPTLTRFGPCPTEHVPPMEPGAERVARLSWDGRVSAWRERVAESPLGTRLSGTYGLAIAPPGPYVLEWTYDGDGTARTLRADVTLRPPILPEVPNADAFTAWSPRPPPDRVLARPETREEWAARPYAHETPLGVPEDAWRAANDSLRARLGDAFDARIRVLAAEAFSVDAFCGRATGRCDAWGWAHGYGLRYAFDAPEINASFGWIELNVTAGLDVVEPRVQGVPDCVLAPSECRFTVDTEEAVRLARNAGLPEGVAPWTVTFVWHRELRPLPFEGFEPDVLGTYAWRVAQTEDERGGDAVTIDANDGRLLQRATWTRPVWT